MSTIIASLHRLMKKGFLQGEFGKATKERGARREKLFTITIAGSKVNLHYSSTEAFPTCWHYISKPY